jgi:hypothetical protein
MTCGTYFTIIKGYDISHVWSKVSGLPNDGNVTDGERNDIEDKEVQMDDTHVQTIFYGTYIDPIFFSGILVESFKPSTWFGECFICKHAWNTSPSSEFLSSCMQATL